MKKFLFLASVVFASNCIADEKQRHADYNAMTKTAALANASWTKINDNAQFLKVYTAYKGCITSALTPADQAYWAFRLADACEDFGDLKEASAFYKHCANFCDKEIRRVGFVSTAMEQLRRQAVAGIVRLMD